MLRLSVDIRSPAELDTALGVVSRQGLNGAVELQFTDGDWLLAETYAEPSLARGRLQEAREPLPDNVVALPYRSREIDARRGPCRSLDILLDVWGTAGGVMDGGLWRYLRFTRLRDGMVVMPFDEDCGQLVFTVVSPVQRHYLGEDWTSRSLGLTIDDARNHDQVFTRRCAAQYRTAFDGERPARHLIDATIEPHRDGERRLRVMYDRLLLPVQFLTGQVGLLSVPVVVPGLWSLAS